MQENEKPYADGWADEDDTAHDQRVASPAPSAATPRETAPIHLEAPASIAHPVSAMESAPFQPVQAPLAEQDEAEEMEPENDAPSGPVFPCWKFPEHFPAFCSRSALFSVERLARADAEPYFKGELRAAEARLSYEGPRLSINDKELFCELASRAKKAKLRLDATLVVPISELADALGWKSKGGDALDWIVDSARRLTEAQVACKPNISAMIEGRMLLSATKTIDGLAVRFDPQFVLNAFGQGRQFLVDRTKRRELVRPLARWLHDYLGTHSARTAIDMTYLREICGYPPLPKDRVEAHAKRKEFPGLVRRASKELQEVAPGLVAGVVWDTKKKSSAEWTATFTAGSDKPKFEKAENYAAKASSAGRAKL